MKEVGIPMIPIQVAAMCDCGGLMELDSTGSVILTDPPRYPYRCKKCGKTEMSEKVYPFMRYQPYTKEETQVVH